MSEGIVVVAEQLVRHWQNYPIRILNLANQA